MNTLVFGLIFYWVGGRFIITQHLLKKILRPYQHNLLFVSTAQWGYTTNEKVHRRWSGRHLLIFATFICDVGAGAFSIWDWILYNIGYVHNQEKCSGKYQIRGRIHLYSVYLKIIIRVKGIFNIHQNVG